MNSDPAAHPNSARGGVSRTWWLSALLIAVALGALPMWPGADAHANGPVLIGIDMQPATNDPDTLGRLQPCTEAEVGAEFSADIFIANVSSLAAWELRLDYDPDVVSVELADYNQMLVSTQPSGSVFPSLFELERAGRHFMAATEINGTPDSGSGVLAHLTLRALGLGESKLEITDTPATHGPRITGRGGTPVGDDNADGVWDGQVTSGMVYVGGDCPAATPIPTPRPGGGSTGGTPGSDDNGDSGSGSDSATGGGNVAVIDTNSVGGGDDGVSGSDSDTNTSPGGDSAGGGGTSETGGDGAVPGTSAFGSDSKGDPGLGDIPFIAGGLALGAVALGAATLFAFRRRGTW